MTEVADETKDGRVIENILSLLVGNGMTCSLSEEGELYVSAGLEYPMFIDYHKELSAIRIFSYARIKAPAYGEIEVLRLANRMNMNFMPSQVYYLDGSIYCCYTIFNSSQALQNFIDTLEHCAGAFVVAAKASDDQNLFGHKSID